MIIWRINNYLLFDKWYKVVIFYEYFFLLLYKYYKFFIELWLSLCLNHLDQPSCEPFNLNEDGTEVAGSLIHNYFKEMKCTYVIGGLIKVIKLNVQVFDI